jgi:hypothetical protein
VTRLSKLVLLVFDTLLQPCNKSLDAVRGQGDNDIDKSEAGSFETACRWLTDLVCPLIPGTLKIEYCSLSEPPAECLLIPPPAQSNASRYPFVTRRLGFVFSRLPFIFIRFRFVSMR